MGWGYWVWRGKGVGLPVEAGRPLKWAGEAAAGRRLWTALATCKDQIRFITAQFITHVTHAAGAGRCPRPGAQG